MPEGAAALVLLGFVGGLGWQAFAQEPEARDGAPHPLDRWSRRVIDALAARLGAFARYPFGGPPHWPFQRWAVRAGDAHPSPLGLLVHPEFGLWHSYRGALAFVRDIGAPAPERRASPCESCVAKPCLTACPVGAFSATGYDVGACRDWLRGPEGGDCMANGCAARRACPVGAQHRHGAAQAGFLMKAFREAG